MILRNQQKTFVDEKAAADYLREHQGEYDGLTPYQVLRAHNDPAFLKSLEISGYGAIHMSDNAAQRQRLYVSMCHRHYTLIGKTEVISAQYRHALQVQKDANRRLKEHGTFMAKSGKEIGQMEGRPEVWEAKKETHDAHKPIFGDVAIGDFSGGFVDTFRYIGIVGVALILAIIYMMYGKGKG